MYKGFTWRPSHAIERMHATFDAKADQRQTKTDFCAFFVRFSHENQLHGWPAFRTFLIIFESGILDILNA